jgi:uncharacterized protein
MVAAGLIIDLLFRALGLVPTHRNASVIETSIQLNYTTVLNTIFLILAAVLVWRFMKTGGPEMLRMMGESADHSDQLGHEGHEHHSH